MQILTYLQNVEEGIQDHHDHLGLVHHQEIAQRLEGAGLDDGHILLKVPASCQVGDGPDCLLLSFVITLDLVDG